MKTLPIKLLILLCFYQTTFSQCFEIESILVDACSIDGEEGYNEMVRFKVGPSALNTSNLNVNWPNNPWEGLVQNSITASKVQALNNDIISAGGCAQLIEPAGGILPANATVILVTSYNFDTIFNSFGALTEDTYIIFQNNSDQTAGHFANYGNGTRTLSMSFGACNDSVSYNRTQLVSPTGENIAADGATVVFTPSGAATYINNGCAAPVQPFTVDIIPTALSGCPGETFTLTATAEGYQSLLWTATMGSFTSTNTLTTSYTIPANATGTIVVTLTATNSCNLEIFDTVSITVTDTQIPDFQTDLVLCNGATAPTLNTTSPNGITGTWSPAVINNTSNGSYVFTPNPNQCASSVTLNVSITNSITPDFQTDLVLCNGATAPTLNTTSPNGITGTWSPAVINNTANGSYVFTPNPNQCASPVTLNVSITNSITPDFQTDLVLCNGATAPTLNTTSPNGITGTWSPAVINNTANGSYVFTPNPNQCASPVTLNVNITNSITPDFQTDLVLCNGATAPTLNTTSPNGITGTWSPAVINNTSNGSYVFTPNPNQCASPVTLNVNITNSITPDFQTDLVLCNGATAPTLNTTSPNGITGTWSPAVINNTANGSYVFTPNPNQCASPVTLNVSIDSIPVVITGSQTLCLGQSTQWIPSVSGGTWSSEDTSIVTIDTNGIITGVSSGITTINYNIADGCASSVSRTIEIIDITMPDLTDSYICIDPNTGDVIGFVDLESGLSMDEYSFVWTLNGTVLPTTQNSHQATETGVYTVTATHILTGCTTSSTANVSTSSIATAVAYVGEDFQQNQIITVTVTGGSGAYEFSLNDGPYQTSNYFNRVRQGENTITVRDLNGCGIIILTVYSLKYPPYFTPNGDGYHDTWGIQGLEQQSRSIIYIFNRYGKLIKTLRPSAGDRWDGTYNGENMPSTDYWFTLHYTNNQGIDKEFKAHFSLKR